MPQTKEKKKAKNPFTNPAIHAIIFPVLARWCSRLARQPVTLEVDGSSPFRVANRRKPSKRMAFFLLTPEKDSKDSIKLSSGQFGCGKEPRCLLAGCHAARSESLPGRLACSSSKTCTKTISHRERNTTRAHRKRGMPWFFLPFTAAPEFPLSDLRRWTFSPPGRSGRPAAWGCWQSGRKRQAPLPRLR